MLALYPLGVPTHVLDINNNPKVYGTEDKRSVPKFRSSIPFLAMRPDGSAISLAFSDVRLRDAVRDVEKGVLSDKLIGCLICLIQNVGTLLTERRVGKTLICCKPQARMYVVVGVMPNCYLSALST